jgi:hypothetical protein
MASLKDRFKAKFGRKEPPITPPDEAPSPSITPQAQSAPDTAISPDNLPDRLWNQAYDLAKTGDSSTVDAYEKLLSARLSEQDAGASTILESADLTLQRNQIAHDAKGRQVQMQQLVQNGLHRTEKAAKVKQGIEGSLQATEVIRDVVSKAVQASPQAAVAWVGVCFALEVCSAATNQTILS